MLEKYLKIRDEFCPKKDHLFVSKTGNALLQQHCRVRFRELCKKLGIKTFYSKIASPHHLRHSFATLNIEPLGLALPIYEIMQRLRHSKLETAKRHYIHNNPYLQKLKHTLYRNKGKKKTSMDILNEIPLPELEHWLSDGLGVDGGTIRTIRTHHKMALGKSVIDKSGNNDNIVTITETDALGRLADLKISAPALRKYALSKGACVSGGCSSDVARYGKNVTYKVDFIDDLATNWAPIETVRKNRGFSRSGIYRAIKTGGWRRIKIGNKRYVHKLDCV